MSFLDKLRTTLASWSQEQQSSIPSSQTTTPTNSPLQTPAEASQIIYSGGTSVDELKRRLELRGIFRDEQLFNELLPRARDISETWTQAGKKSWVDHWSCDSQFIPMDSSRVVFSSILSGFLVSTISTPFDVVKNYWIYAPQFRGTRSAITTGEVVRSLYAQNGLRTFYTGFAATCCTLVPSNLIFFYGYELYRNEAPPAVASKSMQRNYDKVRQRNYDKVTLTSS